MKEILNAFTTLQGSIRVYSICFFLILPFWFADIVLFSDTFYKNHPEHINLLVAFCVSTCWISVLIMCFVILGLTGNFYKTLDTKVENFILYWVTILSILVLGGSTFIFLSCNWFQELSFRWLVLMKFGAGCVSTFIAMPIIKSRVKKEEKKNLKVEPGEVLAVDQSQTSS